MKVVEFRLAGGGTTGLEFVRKAGTMKNEGYRNCDHAWLVGRGFLAL